MEPQASSLLLGIGIGVALISIRVIDMFIQRSRDNKTEEARDKIIKKLEEVSAAFKTEMEEAEVDYQFVNYEGAVHSFTNPQADEFGQKFNLPLAYNGEADQKSWASMQSFFKDIFNYITW